MGQHTISQGESAAGAMHARLLFRLVVVALLLCIGLPWAPAAAATFYVDNACRMNGNGKAATCATDNGGRGAWNSLDAAASCTGMAPGDHVQIRAGTGVYSEGWYATLSPHP